jgi:N-acetylmuramoyl-L-alanine amidase
MKYRVANKKRFTMWCIIFILMIVNLIFALSKRSEGGEIRKADNSSNNSKQIKILDKYSVLAADESGNIVLEENEYFKRYTIDCIREFSSVDSKQSKEYIDISFKKDDITNASLKGSAEVKDIYSEKTSDRLTIRIKKIYNDNNFVKVSSTDSKKIIVLISKSENPFHHSVVLDAGHGGNDVGTVSEGLYEKDINLKILKYAADELIYRGFKVTKTRDNDKFLELSEIGRIVNSSNSDVFISIHINDFKENKYNGFSTYYYDPKGYQKEERLKLANIMQQELIKSDGWFNRGIFKENFQVLRESKIPCVLLECGFLTNSEDRERLKDNSVLKNFGVNIANGLLNYFEMRGNTTE